MAVSLRVYARVVPFVLALVAAVPTAAPAQARQCGWSGYSHVGLADDLPAEASTARITTVRAPRVEAGHVAAWVGFGGHGAGRNGTDAWIQSGVIAYPAAGPQLYVEVAVPGRDPVLTLLGPARIGRGYAFSVEEVRGRKGWWRASVDGRQLGAPVFLPGSHGRWTPTVVSESWDGDAVGCNELAFSFGGVRAAAAGSWRSLDLSAPLRAPGYVFERRPTGFLVRNAV